MVEPRANHFNAAVIVFVAATDSDADLHAQAIELNWPVIVVSEPADALRSVVKERPNAAVMHVTDRAQAQIAANVIRALRDRRPELPLAAVSPSTDASIEQRLRAAGVTCYIAGKLRDSAAALAAMLARRLDPLPDSDAQSIASRLHHGRAPPAASRSPPY